MTTVNVVLTPGVDTDQSVSAQAQITATPSGTLGNETIINMPAGRYRMDQKLRISSKSHIRWTCLAGVQTYPNPAPADSQQFTAYTNLTGAQLGLSVREHFQIINSTNVIGSFLRIDGPNVQRRSANPLYAYWGGTNYNDHGFAIHASTDSGFEDCSWHNVYGDGTYIGGSNTRSVGCHAYRMTGDYAGRMNLALISCINTEVIDYTGDWNGYAGVDIEPLGADEWVWDAYLENIHMGSYFYPYTFMGHETTLQGATVPVGKKNITVKNSNVIRCASVNHEALQTGREADGYLVIDGLTDLRNRNAIGMQLDGHWDSVTVKNCRVRGYPNTITTYGVRADDADSITVINNNFNGTQTDGGADLLVTGTTAANPIYTHYGNVWAMDTQNDGSAPLGGAGAFAPTKPALHGAGTASNQAQGHVEASAAAVAGVGSVSFVDETAPIPLPNVSGAPYRLRSTRKRAQVRGDSGSRMRGFSGPSERHVTRVRSVHGGGYVRSASFSSFIRSGGEGEDITATGAFAAAAASFAGLGAHGEVTGAGAFAGAAATLAATGEETIAATGAFLAANAVLAGVGAESAESFGNFAAAAASLAGAGSAGITGTGAITMAAAVLAGTSTTGATGVGAFAAAPAALAGANVTLGGWGTNWGFEWGYGLIATALGAYTAPAPSLHGTGTVTNPASPHVVPYHVRGGEIEDGGAYDGHISRARPRVAR